MPQSSIIAVGDELLRGFTVDTNSNWLASRLFELGFPVRWISVVGDLESDIVAAVRAHLSRPDVDRIFVCGGLGPTPDDRTYAALGSALGRDLAYDRRTGRQMQNRMFAMNVATRRGTAALNAGNRKMAMIPAGALLLHNAPGMAPGLAFALDFSRYLFALPGVPQELQAIFEQEVAPRFLQGSVTPTVRELRYTGAPESAFFDAMLAAGDRYRDVSIGSYPQPERGELIIRASGPDPGRVAAALSDLRQGVPAYRPRATG